MIPELNQRAQTVLRTIIDNYMETGNAVGSSTLARQLGMALSPATIRNVMAELESSGLLFSPHTSAGRLPTQAGMRFYVDGLMQVGGLSESEQSAIEARCAAGGRSAGQMLEQASALVAGLSSAAGLVVAPKSEKPVRQIQFLQLDSRRLLAVLVTQDGMVENRVLDVDGPTPPTALQAAANYLNSRLGGRTLDDARDAIVAEIEAHRSQLDSITANLVLRGIALVPEGQPRGHIVVRGQSRLLDDVRAIEDLEHARALLAMLEEEETIARLLDAARSGEGVQVYIGTENPMFEHAGWSLAISPYRSPENRIIGAIGVIGPTRLNYSRIIPILDYTARVMGRLMGE